MNNFSGSVDVDTAPTISSIAVASNKTGNNQLAKAGHVLTFTVTFGQTVILSNKDNVKLPFWNWKLKQSSTSTIRYNSKCD